MPLVAFARWDPICDLLAIQQRLDRFAPGPAGWRPPVDLHETAAEYVITAEVPGIEREDLEINAHDSTVTIAGTRRESPDACEQYHRVERGHGSFSRAFQLPSPIDETGVAADLRDGVLTIRCPKVPDNGARRIHVS